MVPIEMPTGQSNVDSPLLKFSSQTVLGCIKLTVERDHHTLWVLLSERSIVGTGTKLETGYLVILIPRMWLLVILSIF